jgi:CheY-specific phosphatase CheX
MSMRSDIEEIAQMIWTTLFDLPLVAAAEAAPGGGASVTSFVHIDGAWRGVVMLQCPIALAVTLTSSMFDGALSARDGDGVSPKVHEAEVRDALGEIANMVAGNVKALLPEPCTISLPAVALGSDDAVSVPGATLVAAVPFTCDGLPFVITLLERADVAREAV